MTWATIFEKNINKNLQSKFILAIIYMKNNWPIKAVQNPSFYKIYTYKLFNLSYF